METRRVVVYRSSTPNKDQAVSNDKNAILVCSGGEASAAAGTDFDDSVFVQNYVGEALLTAGSDVFSGFWVTNYRRVLDSLLLPRLRIINAASELKIGQPTWENQMYVPNYEIRRDFKSAAEDKVWAEEWSSHDFSVTDAATEATHSYAWRSEDGPYSLESTLEKQGKSLRSSLSIAGERSLLLACYTFLATGADQASRPHVCSPIYARSQHRGHPGRLHNHLQESGQMG